MDHVSAPADQRPLRVDLLRRPPRLFATPADEPRARRVGDAIQLGACLALLAVVTFAASPAPGFERAVTRLVDALPPFLDTVWQVLADGAALVALVVAASPILHRRWSVARDVALAAVVAAVLWLAARRGIDGAGGARWEALTAAAPPAWYPSLRLALVATVVLTALPHVTLPMRRLGLWVVGAGSWALVALGATSALGAVAGFLVAGSAAAAVHLLLGSSAGRPGLELVRDALAQLGVATRTVGVADRQQAGVFVVDAVGVTGDDLVVKVYGRDAQDTAVGATLWRRVWYREAGSPLRVGRLQQVEHEAFLTLFARQAGVASDHVVTAGATASDDALLVLRRRGVLLAEADDGGGPDVPAGVWDLLRRLHDAGVAHGQVDDRHLLVADGELGLVDFRGATVAATDSQRRTDELQALVTTAHLVGSDRAVAAALDALGPDELTAMLPYVQRVMLTARQRRWVADGEVDIDGLRTAAATTADTTPPDLIELRRVTIGSLVRFVLPVVAVVLLLSELAGLDYGEFANQVQDSTWWLVAVGFLVTQLPRFSQAISTLGASPVPLPLGPVYALQLAVSYINVAIPTGVARVAVNVRFFQRHGVPPAAAVASGAIDGFGGFVAQAAILAGLLLFTGASLDVDVDAQGAFESAWPMLAVALGVAATSIAVVAAVGRWRRFVVGWAGRLGREAWQAASGLRSPRRVAQLLGGNLATEVLFALALATFARALGSPVGLGTALLVNISVALLAGLVPVPGGIGVAEGGLTFGLVQAGVPEETALATVLLYRMASFYLPPTWGFFALRWLERNEQL